MGLRNPGAFITTSTHRANKPAMTSFAAFDSFLSFCSQSVGSVPKSMNNTDRTFLPLAALPMQTMKTRSRGHLASSSSGPRPALRDGQSLGDL